MLEEAELSYEPRQSTVPSVDATLWVEAGYSTVTQWASARLTTVGHVEKYEKLDTCLDTAS